jgi:hypothetical protein
MVFELDEENELSVFEKALDRIHSIISFEGIDLFDINGFMTDELHTNEFIKETLEIANFNQIKGVDKLGRNIIITHTPYGLIAVYEKEAGIPDYLYHGTDELDEYLLLDNSGLTEYTLQVIIGNDEYMDIGKRIAHQNNLHIKIIDAKANKLVEALNEFLLVSITKPIKLNALLS